MATRLLENKTDERQLLRAARKRVRMPAGWLEMSYSRELEMSYSREADVLFVRFSKNKSARSSGDMEKGIIYDYDGRGKIVSIEITNLFNIYAAA